MSGPTAPSNASTNKMDELIKDIEQMGRGLSSGWNGREAFESKYKKTFMKMLNDLTDQEKALLDDVLCAAIRCGCTTVTEIVVNTIFDKRKLIDWKSRADLINKIVDTLIEAALIKDESNCQYSAFSTKFLEMLKSNQILEKHANKLFEVIRAAFKTKDDPNRPILNAALPFITQFPWTSHTDCIVEACKLVKDAVMFNPDVSESAWLATDTGIIYPMMFRSLQGKEVHLRVLDDVSELFNFCADQDLQWSEDPSQNNICYKVLQMTLEDFLGSGSTIPALVKPMITKIRELWESGDDILSRDANYVITAVADQMDMVGDQTEQLLEQYLEGKQPALAAKLQEMYKKQPEAFHPLLPKFLKYMTTDVYQKMVGCQLFTAVAKHAPQALPANTVEAMVDLFTDESAIYLAIMFLDQIAINEPKKIIPYDQKLIEVMNSTENASSMVAGILTKLCIDETYQRKYLGVFANKVQSMTGGPFQLAFLYNMRTVGLRCPAILSEHKAMFLKLRERPDLKDACQSALDVIEGRTLEGVSEEVTEQRKDINHLDTKVTKTEDNVGKLTTDVNQNKQDITTVKGDVTKQGQHLAELQETVDDTVVKVDDLDHKTLSHAPAWSIEVAKLLNPKADHDWRLLSSRLGYSNDDIRNWATQPNPCLSMFDEWFATHKTREATYGILKTLVEMDRKDASVIVDEALKKVEHVIEDDEEEPAVPPPVFLSYQWAHQSEVKLLKRHLAMAGYGSWMDIGQMGGGDKLFAKIDSGIRAAKVIVCCVTERYAESPNCNREVNLSVTLGKPIIPLLVEKMSWPPPGSMGPIFGEYIFVRFFQRSADEKTGDDRFWPADKFTELLFQLRYTIAPDNSLITSDSSYKDWWHPPEEVIVIKPRNNKSLPAVESPDANATAKLSASPDVFISYQWDKQPQIKALYRCLTQLGYTCWLDIMQMGGGDSLYDKIDRGVRGCKVIVSCITSKYALSANCRREVSLADAIKKPIVPILLEKSSAWPPEGPMGMVFTQLVYINFCKPNEDIQKDWKCPQFDELLQKLDQYLQPMTDTQQKSNGKSTTTEKTENKSQKAAGMENDVVFKQMSNEVIERKPSDDEKKERREESRPSNTASKDLRSSKSSLCNIL